MAKRGVEIRRSSRNGSINRKKIGIGVSYHFDCRAECGMQREADLFIK